MGDAAPIWVDGTLRPADAAAVRADDSAFSEGRGCYTSVRIRAGAPTFAKRHAQRLERDARALGRLPGWIAQWIELHGDPDFKIGRPRQIYTGPTITEYVPLDQR